MDNRDTRAILRPHGLPFELRQVPPGPLQAPFVETYWRVRWDLDAPHTQHIAGFPAVNAVLQRPRSTVTGVVSGLFERVIEGSGQVFGVRYRIGGFRAVFGRPVRELTDQVMPWSEVFGDCRQLEDQVLGSADLQAQVAWVEAALPCPVPDPVVDEVARITAAIQADPSLVRAEDLATIAGRSLRSLQRLFREYVGMSPKAVLRRYRLQEVAERLANGDAVDQTELALSLGYCDQAHMVRDFTQLTGVPPSRYARQATGGQS